MRILVLGDLMGISGRDVIKRKLPKIIKENKIDFSIINGENASDDGKGILITNVAIEQISSLLKNQTDKNALRVGVRSGGCSGMSYTMDFIGGDEINADDKVYDYSLSSEQTFQVICDPKSLLYIYGMQLDFSKDLIGGGFNFVNPNASQTCGCGSSFAV